jgi:hypothetical protein
MNVQHHFELASAAHIFRLFEVVLPDSLPSLALPFAQDATLYLPHINSAGAICPPVLS